MTKVYDLDTENEKIEFYSKLSKDYELLSKYFAELSKRIGKNVLYTKDLFYKIDSAINKKRKYSRTIKNIITEEYNKCELYFNTLDYINYIHNSRYEKE